MPIIPRNAVASKKGHKIAPSTSCTNKKKTVKQVTATANATSGYAPNFHNQKLKKKTYGEIYIKYPEPTNQHFLTIPKNPFCTENKIPPVDLCFGGTVWISTHRTCQTQQWPAGHNIPQLLPLGGRNGRGMVD